MEYITEPKLKSIGRNLFDSEIVVNVSEHLINYEISDNDGLVGRLTCDFLSRIKDAGFEFLYTSNLKEVLKNQHKSLDELLNFKLLCEEKSEKTTYKIRIK